MARPCLRIAVGMTIAVLHLMRRSWETTTTRTALVVALAVIASGRIGRAAETAVQGAAVPTVEVRGLVGTGIALEGAASLLGHRLRAEIGTKTGGLSTGWLDGAVLVRVLGPAESSLWLRGGVQLQHISWDCSDGPDYTDDAQALDAGLAYRRRFGAGHLVAFEGGVEYLRRRGAFFCNDSSVHARSLGARVALTGQWAFTPRLSGFGRLGVRTADHAPEIHILPEALVGLTFEI
jgi:hypothetical protein